MSLTNIEKNITLDVYDHDTTPSVIKAIQMDKGTRTVYAGIQNSRQDYDIGQNASVKLIVLRPDKTKVQITGQPFISYTGTDGTMYGAKAELSDVALAVKGNLKAQFKITSGEQELRTEIFAINNGEALDAGDGDWAGDLDGHNLDEMAESIETLQTDMAAVNEDVSDLKEGLTSIVGGEDVTLDVTPTKGKYYTAVVGEQIAEASNTSSDYITVDLSAYIGRTLTVNYLMVKSASLRKTAMCSPSGVVGYVDSELNVQNVFAITADYPIAYISCTHGNFGSATVSGTGIIPQIQSELEEMSGDIADLSVEIAESASVIEPTKNLIVPDNFEYGSILSDGTDGGYSASYKRTVGYIEIKPLTAYTCKNVYLYCQYKEDGTFISPRTVIEEAETTFTTDSNAKYIRIVIRQAYFDSPIYLNEGSVLIEESYHDPYLNNNISLQSKNPYYGMKYAALGDSITYGFRPRNDTTDPSPITSYAKLTAERLGMVFYNHGISASTVGYVADHNPMSRRWDQIPNDADIITVMGGANDIRQGVPVGTMADRDDSTFYGALHVIFSGLYKKFYIDQGAEVGKRKKIIAITPLKLLNSSPSEIGGDGTLRNLEPYVQAFKDVAQYYSFPCLDMYNLSQLNPSLYCTVQGTDGNAPNIYTIYQPDGTHPTQAAAQMMADLLEGFLLSLK